MSMKNMKKNQNQNQNQNRCYTDDVDCTAQNRSTLIPGEIKNVSPRQSFGRGLYLSGTLFYPVGK